MSFPKTFFFSICLPFSFEGAQVLLFRPELVRGTSGYSLLSWTKVCDAREGWRFLIRTKPLPPDPPGKRCSPLRSAGSWWASSFLFQGVHGFTPNPPFVSLTTDWTQVSSRTSPPQVFPRSHFIVVYPFSRSPQIIPLSLTAILCPCRVKHFVSPTIQDCALFRTKPP